MNWGFLAVFFDCDANATYAPDEAIRGVISECIDSLGNPSSLHRGGQRARALLEESRAAIRSLVGAGEEDSVVFTSGATEANNTVILGVDREGEIVSSAVEHPCVLEPLARLGPLGRKFTLLRPDEDGAISVAKVEHALSTDVALVSLMAANNEMGTISPIREISGVVRERAPRALMHTDAAQLLGKGAVNFRELGVDVMTISGHKIGALSGIGAIIVREGVRLSPLIQGGAQEGKLRGGTENVLGAAVFGAVARVVERELDQRIASMRAARDLFERELHGAVSGIEVNGVHSQRLPNTSSVYIPGVRADDLVVAMDLAGVLLSSGAACSSGKPEPSHVLIAMGQGTERARSTIRVSFRADATSDAVRAMVAELVKAVSRMRAVASNG
jgi:cysteine desulfurase